MSFAEEDVRAVREATDLVALISERVPLRRQGRRFVGRCPFHAERTPSFSVDAERGLYYCFGCQASGDAITFVRATEGLDFVGALRRLADRAGVSLREVEDDPAEALARRRRRKKK
jgi:DNA primase